MTVKQKAAKWLAHFALAVTLVMGTAATAGSAEASISKVVIKILEKIAKATKAAKIPSDKRDTEWNVKWVAIHLGIRITCRHEDIQCLKRLRGEVERKCEGSGKSRKDNGICKRWRASPAQGALSQKIPKSHYRN